MKDSRNEKSKKIQRVTVNKKYDKKGKKRNHSLPQTMVDRSHPRQKLTEMSDEFGMKEQNSPDATFTTTFN